MALYWKVALWPCIAGMYCGLLLQESIVVYYCREVLWTSIVKLYCRVPFGVHCCREVLCSTIAGKFYDLLLKGSNVHGGLIL